MTLEERARELRERLDQFIDREGEWNMAFQADAEILETLTRGQAEARKQGLDEAADWLEVNHRDDEDEQWEACCNLPDKIRALATLGKESNAK